LQDIPPLQVWGRGREKKTGLEQGKKPNQQKKTWDYRKLDIRPDRHEGKGVKLGIKLNRKMTPTKFQVNGKTKLLQDKGFAKFALSKRSWLQGKQPITTGIRGTDMRGGQRGKERYVLKPSERMIPTIKRGGSGKGGRGTP